MVIESVICAIQLPIGAKSMRFINESPLVFSKVQQPYPFFGFLRFTGNKKWDYLILGTVGLVLLGLFIYALTLWRWGDSSIQYNAGNVVYGQKIHAVHVIDANDALPRPDFSAAASSVKPEMRLSETYYNFGSVDDRQILSRTFVIANSGQTALVIRRAYTTCGCTTADFTASKIPPGKIALMTLQFDAAYHDMRGTTVRRGVMIETNDPDQPTQEVWIQASVR
jgi:hypothetical protein